MGAVGMLTGGCQCGQVGYESSGEVLALYACHCRECRRQSASAFGLSLLVPGAGFLITRGAPKIWSRSTDSGHPFECAFCPNCGTRLWHRRVDVPETISIKAGSLDEPIDISAAIHIWTSRKLPGVVIPEGARQYSEEPE